MDTKELRTLRGQIMLLAALFLGSVLVGSILAFQRAFFEQFISETYSSLPARLQPLAEAATTGFLDPIVFEKLSLTERLALYEDWMSRPDPPPTRTPETLVTLDAPLYLARAERSIVSGRPEQKLHAVAFLESTGSKAAIPVLRKAGEWASRQRRHELADRIVAALHRLER